MSILQLLLCSKCKCIVSEPTEMLEALLVQVFNTEAVTPHSNYANGSQRKVRDKVVSMY